MKKLGLSRNAWLLLASSSLLLASCKSFPKVTQRTIDVMDGQVYCTWCADDIPGGCEERPIEDCDKTIGYGPRDQQRVMTWARKRCK